jgi:hypothetical protein
VYELELLSIVQRVRSEYEELPGLALTVPQSARLWRLDDGIVEDVMATLVDVHYLCLCRTGFVRKSADKRALPQFRGSLCRRSTSADQAELR